MQHSPSDTGAIEREFEKHNKNNKDINYLLSLPISNVGRVYDCSCTCTVPLRVCWMRRREAVVDNSSSILRKTCLAQNRGHCRDNMVVWWTSIDVKRLQMQKKETVT